jgi:hypothetical protein
MMFGWNKNKSYSTVTVNGKTVHVRGNNISIINDKIIVDGKPLDEAMDAKSITVIVEGNCNRLDTCGDVEIKGDCGYVDCSGNCHIEGNVTGNVDASGSVTCGDVGGDIDASGSVRCTRK